MKDPDHSDLIGRCFTSGDGVWTYRVLAIDSESPHLLRCESVDTGGLLILLADFVRPYLVPCPVEA